MKRIIALVLLLLSLILAPRPPDRPYEPPTLSLSSVAYAFPSSLTADALPLEWHLSQVGAQTAWAQGADGHGVSVLVIDSGLDRVVATTALSGAVVAGYAAPVLHQQVSVPCTYEDPDMPDLCSKDVLVPNPSAYIDTIGHGTFVACEIACRGQVDNYYGIAPAAKVAMAKVFLTAGGDSRDIAAAIRWGAIHKFPIISMSLGGEGTDPDTQAAVKFALSRGTLVVAAAGNDGSAVLNYPAGYPGVISVGATDRWEKLTSWSTHGPGLQLTAPGDWIFGIGPNHPTEINCAGLCLLEGTSMATPLVAGALADLLSLGMSTTHAKASLLAGVTHWPGIDPLKYGGGILSLARSVTYAREHGWVK